jgi:VCBS repeat-containing protein
VANAGSNSVSVIDLTQNPPAVVATITVGNFPGSAALSADGSRLYVPNFKVGTLSIISTAGANANTVVHTATVGTDPDGVVEVGGVVYVANLLSGSITVVNPTTGNVTGTITLPSGASGAAAPSGLAPSADGHTLYANDSRNGRTLAIDLTQSPPVVSPTSVGVGTKPAYLSLAGNTGYVANPGSNTVSVLGLGNPLSPTLSGTVTVGSRPYGVVALPALNEVFTANAGSNNVSVIDTSTPPGATVGSSTQGVGSLPDAIAVGPDHQTAVISNEGSGTISVFHVNQPPTLAAPSGTLTATYNATAGANNQLVFSGATKISTADSDAGSNPVEVAMTVAHGTLTLSSTSGLTFLNGSTNGSGALTFTGSQSDVNTALNDLAYEPAAGYTGPDSLGMVVDDQGNSGLGTAQSAKGSVALTVHDSAPTGISLSKNDIDENLPAGTTIGTLSATDPDPGDTSSFTLASSGCGGGPFPDNGSFQISGDSLQSTQSFDFETKSSYTICVRATDIGNETFDQQLTIQVNDVNEAPTDISLSNSSINENVAAPATIGTLTATDPDHGQSHTFSLPTTGCGGGPFPDNSSFQISGSTLQSAVSFDFETKNSYTICIRTTDSGSPPLSLDKQFTITINDVNDPPVAVTDNYSDPVGNTLAAISTTPAGPHVTLTAASGTGSTLIANDTDQDNHPGGQFAHALSAVAETVTTAHGGTATINSDGSFTYLPAAGDRSTTDSFTYHVTDGSLTTAGTVNITIPSTMVWYVNNALASNGDGRSSSPFNSLSGVDGVGGSNDADSPGDILFLYQGSGNYTNGLVLEAGQQLIGQPFGLTVSGQTIVPAGGSNPVITNSAGSAITLADGNTLQAVNASGASGAGVTGSGVNTLSYGASTTISGNTGGGLLLSGGGNGTISVGAAISQTNAAGHSVSIAGRIGGTTSLTGAVTDTGAGISLSSNTGATITFSGGVMASTGANTAFGASGGGTVNVTGAGNTLATTTATALSVQNTNIGSSGLTFLSISAGTASGSSGDGIVLDGTGSSGGLTVTGNSSGTCGGTVTGSAPSLSVTAPNSADCTGGVIQHETGTDGSTTSGIGIYLNNTGSVSLNRMWLHDFDNFGIFGSSVSGLTISNSLFNGSNGTNQNGSGEGAVYVFGLSGAASVSNSFFSGGAFDSFHVENDVSQVLNRITFEGDNFGDTLNATSGSALFMQADCSATLKATIDTSVFTAARANNVNVSIRAQTTDDLVVSNSQFSNSDPNQVSGGSNLAIGAGGPSSGCVDNTLNPTLTYNIHNNTFRDALGTAISISKGGVGAGSFGTTANPGVINSNTIGVSSNSASSGAGGIGAILVGGGSITTNITNNTIHGAINGISIGANSTVAGGGQGYYTAVLTGNTVDTPNIGAGNITNGLLAQFGSISTDDPKACLTLGGSTAALKNNLQGGANGGGDLRLRVRFGTLIGVVGYSGANNDNTAMTNLLNSQNVFGSAGAVVTNNATTGSGWSGTCPAP